MSHQGGDESGPPVLAGHRVFATTRPSARPNRFGPVQGLIPSGRSRGTAYGEGMSEGITARRFHESAGVEDWRVVGEGACTYFRTGSFEAAARLVSASSELAGLDDHHPDVDLRHEGVMVRLITVRPDYYGLSERGLGGARERSAGGRNGGDSAEPTA